MTKEMEIIKTLKIDKQDIVTVALSKIESKIRKTVRDSKEQVGLLAIEILNLKGEIPTIREANIPVGLTKKMNTLNKSMKSVKLGKMAEWTIRTEGHHNENVYFLEIVNLDEKGRYEDVLNVVSEIIPLLKSQKDILKKIDKAETARRVALDRGVEWKAKLTEMPAAERHMRAIVVETELKKTTEGKALLKVLVDNYEDTIKQISMT